MRLRLRRLLLLLLLLTASETLKFLHTRHVSRDLLSLCLRYTHAHTHRRHTAPRKENDCRENVKRDSLCCHTALRGYTRFALLLICFIFILLIHTTSFVSQWNFTSSRANLCVVCTLFAYIYMYVPLHSTSICMYVCVCVYLCVFVYMHTICCCCPLGCCYIFLFILFLLNKQLRCPKRR